MSGCLEKLYFIWKHKGKEGKTDSYSMGQVLGHSHDNVYLVGISQVDIESGKLTPVANILMSFTLGEIIYFYQTEEEWLKVLLLIDQEKLCFPYGANDISKL